MYGGTWKTKRERNEFLRGQLALERSTFEPFWRDAGDYILPRRPRFFVSDANKGDRRNTKIIDGTATKAVDVLSAGMMAGVTSPARDWKKLTTPDPDLAEFGPVKEWLDIVNRRMAGVFLRSNIYNSFPILYGDIAVFGTSAMIIEEDFEKVIRTDVFPIGSYMIAKDYRGKVNVFFREFRMTVRQLVEQFGEIDKKTGKPNWDKFSEYVRTQWEESNYEAWVDVCHVIQPNMEYDPGKLHAKHKKFSSCYYEKGTGSASSAGFYLGGGDEDKYLRESGYDYFPVLCPRWKITGEDVYGTSCPGIDAIGDVKALQVMHRRKAQAVEKKINPPLVGGSVLRNVKTSILPGDITFVDENDGQKGLRPIHEVNLNIVEIREDIRDTQQRIKRFFHEDIILLSASDDRLQPRTAAEIAERKEEKLLAFGPVLERLNYDVFDDTIDITFDIMLAQQLVPPPPQELEGVDLKVEYVSTMAQAQKLVGISGQERFTTYVANLAAVKPDVWNKVDVDEMIEVYGDSVGVAPKIIRSKEDADDLAAKQAQALQGQQMMDMISQGAGAARDLAGADTGGRNALTDLLQQGQAGAIAPAA